MTWTGYVWLTDESRNALYLEIMKKEGYLGLQSIEGEQNYLKK
jgi:hypothetical protein